MLTPTRELCVQVTEEIRRIGVFRNVGAVAIYGGSSMERQITALKRGTPVVVGTPGRVLDLIRRGELRLDRVHTVILDEADRMLDMGFIVDVETILSRCPRKRQTALFSATMPYAILRICDRFMDARRSTSWCGRRCGRSRRCASSSTSWPSRTRCAPCWS